MNHESRRNFLKTTSLLSGIGFSNFAQNPTTIFPIESQNGKLIITSHEKGQVIKPLDVVTITSTESGYFFIRDGRFRMYRKGDGKVNSITFKVGGALGNHFCELRNGSGDRLDSIYFTVNCQTEIVDSTGIYRELLQTLYWSMMGEFGETSAYRINGQIYKVFVGWLRDHTHTMKAMKYFNPNLKDGFDLYADYQREDGMVWDNIYPRTKEPNWWDSVLEKGNFIKKIENGRYELKRQPVEADVEYLFVECLYYSWKATGDNDWMRESLDKAIKAITYSTSNTYRWSKKYQLVKRAFTIDTWDFKHEYDTKATDDANMLIDEKTDFGIMFGDNNGLIAAYRMLSEMLLVCGRKDEANFYRQESKNIQERLDKLAWNGQHYTHFIPEDSQFFQKRNIGKTKPNEQVSLSNAYALNRGVSHLQALGILNEYQKIRGNMPKNSVAEWYNIYPPFEQGFQKDGETWEYINGGVSSIVAGELAHGAFQNGYETYGVDILNRILNLTRKHDNYLHGTYKGALTEKKVGNFTPISLAKSANADFSGKSGQGIPGWNGDGEDNDASSIPLGQHAFLGIPFQITDPLDNAGKGCIVVSDDTEKDYQISTALLISKKASTIYLLHAHSKGDMIGTVTIRYGDGTTFTDYIYGDKIGNWWFPQDKPNFKVAWFGKNKKSPFVGLGITQIINPNPDKIILSVEFFGMKNSKSRWMIAGVTLGDTLIELKGKDTSKDDLSFGIPDRWGAAAVTYALLEGLAGIKDTATMFERVKLSPRWEASGEREVAVTVKYEASGGYFTYQYKLSGNKLSLTFTGTGTQTDIEILLPQGNKPTSLRVNGNSKSLIINKIENSDYLIFSVDNLGVSRVDVEF
ncbi:MAG: hypothetical protein V4585_03525 [Bacteroidota bacterium]